MEEVNTLWHFGDSFACWGNPHEPNLEAKVGFSKYIANYYKCKFKHYGQEGASNEIILNKIIKNLNDFKSDDIIIINWSFFTRCTYSDMYDKPKSFNTLQSNISENVSFSKSLSSMMRGYKQLEISSPEYLEYLFMYKSNFTYHENIVLWKTIINPILLNLQDIGCKVINCFNDNMLSDTRVSQSSISDSEPHLVVTIDTKFLDKTLYKINWREPHQTGGEYIHFLHENGFYGEGEDVHYKFGIQEKLANEWITRIDKQFFPKLI